MPTAGSPGARPASCGAGVTRPRWSGSPADSSTGPPRWSRRSKRRTSAANTSRRTPENDHQPQGGPALTEPNAFQESLQHARETQRLIRERTEPSLRESTGQGLLYEYRDQPKPTLRILVGRRGRASLTVTRNKDGTLSCRSPHAWHGPGTRILDSAALHFNDLRRLLTCRTMEQVIRATPRRNLARALADPYNARMMSERAMKTAGKIFAESFAQAQNNGRTLDVNPERIIPLVNNILRKKFLDRETLDLAQAYLCPSYAERNQVTFREYNLAAVNLRTFRLLRRDQPHVLRFFCRMMMNRDRERTRAGTPGAVVHQVREKLGLYRHPARWRYFVRGLGLAPHEEHGAAGDPERRIRRNLRVLDEINLPQAGDDLLKRVVENLSHVSREENPAHYRAWIRMLRGYVRYWMEGRQVEVEEYRRMSDLRGAQDALHHTIQHGGGWNTADWELTVRRSEAWHEWVRENRERELLALTWDSRLGETRLGDVTARPVTTGRELVDLGRAMGNCLGSFVTRCSQGSDRIFTLWEKGELAAAAQLTRHRDRWQPGQLEAPRRSRPPEAYHRLHRELAELYNGAAGEK